MIVHPAVVGAGVKAGVAQYPLLVDHLLHHPPTPIPAPYPLHQYHQSHHATHAHIPVPSVDLVPAHDHVHDQDPKDGMNPIHGLIRNMKLTSAPEKNPTRRGWRFAVGWLRSVIIPIKNQSQCDHGVKIIKNYYLLHHLRLFGWMKILRIM